MAQIVRFAEQWADAMEIQMGREEEISASAERLSYEIDAKEEHPLTFTMFQTAVGILNQHWVYGYKLREWHNRRFAPPGSDPATFGDKLIDCTMVGTFMGPAKLIASYREVMQSEGGYAMARNRAAGAMFIVALEKYYKELGVVA